MKYLRTLFLALQAEFASRVNVLGWFIVVCIPAVAMILVWFAILGERQSIGGFTKGDFIVYYLFVTLGWYLVGGNFCGPLGRAIKNGDINVTLLKPYNVVLDAAIKEQAWKILSIIISTPVILIILFYFKDIIHFKINIWQVFLLIFSLCLGALNFAFIEALVGISAFWVIEYWPLSLINDILRDLFGGTLVPLTLMPHFVLSIANILPFKYMFYVPVSILLSKTNTPLLDVGFQLLYLLILYVIYQVFWRLGIKKYEAVGS